MAFIALYTAGLVIFVTRPGVRAIARGRSYIHIGGKRIRRIGYTKWSLRAAGIIMSLAAVGACLYARSVGYDWWFNSAAVCVFSEVATLGDLGVVGPSLRTPLAVRALASIPLGMALMSWVGKLLWPYAFPIYGLRGSLCRYGGPIRVCSGCLSLRTPVSKKSSIHISRFGVSGTCSRNGQDPSARRGISCGALSLLTATTR